MPSRYPLAALLFFTREFTEADRLQHLPDSSINPQLWIPLRTDLEGYLPLGGARGYVAVDPFVPSVAQSIANFTYPSNQMFTFPQPNNRPPTPLPPPPYQTAAALTLNVPTSKYILAFVLDTLPRQIYLHFLLTLPSLYFSRVARIFEEAELSMPYIKKMVVVSGDQWKDQSASALNANWNLAPSIISPHFSHLKASWEHFIDSLTKEWKTLNIVSVLLLSTILTTLQIDGATTDPVTRYAALLALVCSLMSLLYGCLYILRFNTMRKAHKAAEWAEEAQKTQTLIWWNVWVLLALPSIWLSWSIIFYLTCVMSFVWRTGTSRDPVLALTPLAALGPRIAVTVVFTLGVVYLALIISEFRRYGDVMDRAWKNRIVEWGATTGSTYDSPSIRRRASNMGSEAAFSAPSRPPSGLAHARPLPPSTEPSKEMPVLVVPEPLSQSPQTPTAPDIFKTTKVMDLRFLGHVPYDRPPTLDERGIRPDDWMQFIAASWDGQHPGFQQDPEQYNSLPLPRLPPQDTTARVIAWWNAHLFLPRGAQAILCEEHTLEDPASPSHAIYLVNIQEAPGEMASHSGFPPSSAGLAERFGSVPEGLERIDVYDPVPETAAPRPMRMGKILIYAGPHTARVHWRSSRKPEPRWLHTTDAGSEEDKGEVDSVVQDSVGEGASHRYPRSAMRRARASPKSSDDDGAAGDDEGDWSDARTREVSSRPSRTAAVGHAISSNDRPSQLRPLPGPRPRFDAPRWSGASLDASESEDVGGLTDVPDHGLQ
ncbi:hypothetical protein DXG01_005790 [Tephrocybe rancida]|nr:hypothetical protein DXG01_005790 [Tephrocybe rancida]